MLLSKRALSFAFPGSFATGMQVSLTAALLAPTTVPSPPRGLLNMCGMSEFPFLSSASPLVNFLPPSLSVKVSLANE